MRKSMRRLLFGAGIFFGFLVVLVLAFGFFFDLNRYKSRMESAVSESTGMDLKILGDASLGVFPRLRIQLKDVHLSNRGREILAAKDVEIVPRLVPFLLRREVSLSKVSVGSPKVSVEKSADGRMSFEDSRRKSAGGQVGQLHSLSVENGVLTYVDRSTGNKTELKGFNAELPEIEWDAEKPLKSVSVRGDIRVKSLKLGAFTASDLRAVLSGDHGQIRISPLDANLFGGDANGSMQIDLRGKVPKVSVVENLSRIDLSQALSSHATGSANAKLDLRASGGSIGGMTETLDGTVSIQSRNITVAGIDVDDLADNLGSAQNSLGLVNLGSGLISGLFTLVPGQAAGVSGELSGDKSEIRKLVSNWKIENGIAEATDVAFSTGESTVAFKGKLDLIERRYQDFYVATVDSRGCVRHKVKIEGSLKSPKPSVGSLGKGISGSFLGKAGSAIGGIFDSDDQSECDLFYSGEVVRSG